MNDRKMGVLEILRICEDTCKPDIENFKTNQSLSDATCSHH